MQIHFHAYLCTQPKLLKAIRSSDKYAWAQPQVLQESSVNVSEGNSKSVFVLLYTSMLFALLWQNHFIYFFLYLRMTRRPLFQFYKYGKPTFVTVAK